MKLHIYSVFDSVAEVFNKPFTDINDATAIRAFVEGIKDNPHKNDYQLFYLGEYHDSTGDIIPVKSVKRIYSGHSIKQGDETIIEE